MQALHQPPRQRRHAQVPFGWVDAARAQQFYENIPQYHVTQDDVSAPPPMARGGKDDRHGHQRAINRSVEGVESSR